MRRPDARAEPAAAPRSAGAAVAPAVPRCLLAAPLVLLLLVARVHAGDADGEPADAAARGAWIAAEMARRDAGFGDAVATATMTLRDRAGGAVERRFEIRWLEVPGDGDRCLIVFREPRAIAGTALLTHAHRDADEDQWLLLPALRRVKRISSGGRNAAFVSSQFSYEDLTPWVRERFAYVWLRDEELGGRPCRVIEMRPLFAGSDYARRVAWIDRERWQPLRIDGYDERGGHLKTLTLGEWSLHRDRHWRPALLTMLDQRSGNATELRIADYRFATGLAVVDFDEAALTRIR